MKAGLYWRLSDQKWFYSLEDIPVGGSDGVEFHGDYEISLAGATVYDGEYGKMVDYNDHLYTLKTTSSKVPFIFDDDGNRIFMKARKV